MVNLVRASFVISSQRKNFSVALSFTGLDNVDCFPTFLRSFLVSKMKSLRYITWRDSSIITALSQGFITLRLNEVRCKDIHRCVFLTTYELQKTREDCLISVLAPSLKGFFTRLQRSLANILTSLCPPISRVISPLDLLQVTVIGIGSSVSSALSKPFISVYTDRYEGFICLTRSDCGFWLTDKDFWLTVLSEKMG